MRRHSVFVWVLAFSQFLALGQNVRWIKPGGEPTAVVAAGNYMVTAAPSGLLQVWDMSGGTPAFVKTLSSLPTGVWRMSISEDGSTVVAEDGNLHVGIWTLPNGPDTVMGLGRFSEVTHQRTSNRLLMRNDSTTIHVANLAGGFGGFVSSFDPGVGSGALRATQDDDLLAFVVGPRATLYRISTGESWTLAPPNGASGGSVAFPDDGSRMAMSAHKSDTDTNQNSIYIWDTASRSIIKTLSAADAVSMSFSPDASRLLVTDSQMNVSIWDIASGTGHPIENSVGKAAAFISNQVLALGRDMIDLVTGERRAYSSANAMPPNIAFNASGSLVSDGVRVWDAASGAQQVQLHWPAGEPPMPMMISSRLVRPIAPFRFMENDTKFIAGARVFSMTTGDQVGTLPGTPLTLGTDWYVSLEPSSTNIATVRRYSDGAIIRELLLDGFTQTYSAAISPSQALIATGGALGSDPTTAYNTRIWDATTGNLVRTALTHVGVATQSKFSSDGRLIAAAGEASATFAGVWDVQTGRQVFVSETFSAPADAMDLLPGSDFLVEGYDGLNIWDLHASNIVTRLTTELQHVTSIAVSPDGSKLAAARLDGTVVMIDLTPQDRMSVDRVRGQPALSFLARTGVNYTLECSADLQTWTLVTNVIGSGTRFTKAVPSDRSIFYRLR